MVSFLTKWQCLYDYARELGIPISLGKMASMYSEDETHAHVTFEDGTVESADVIVAADGIGSRAHTVISQVKPQPVTSGYAMFRATFPLKDALADTIVRAHWADKKEHLSVILGPNVHIVIGRNDAQNSICWLLTHKDKNRTSSESWSAETAASDALEFVPESLAWAEFIRALIRSTTNNKCVNWRLMWRDPQPRWYSQKGRVIQIGDACHSFLPTSGSGAVMAIEDGFGLAACLSLAGKSNVPLAVRVHSKLR